MLLVEVAETSATVAGSAARLIKIEALATCLRRAGPADVGVVVAFLSGDLVQRQIGVGWASLRDLPPPAATPSLDVRAVDDAFAAIGGESGAGSSGRRRALLAGLFAAASASEQGFLRGLLSGELRQGAQEGVMVEAVARAAAVPAAEVRRALTVRGDLGVVAAAALADGSAGLSSFRLEVGRGVRPMLAQSATDVGAALEKIRPAALEWKLDGVRIQVHRSGADVRVFTRTLDDVTARVPEIVAATLALPVGAAVFDGEAIALGEDGRPRPFQVTAGRFGTRTGVAAHAVPLTPFLFDVLHLDGTDLLDAPAADRWAALEAVVPPGARVERAVTDDPEVAAAFLADAVGRGHEGVMAKSLTSRYEAGRRGAGWLKVKPRHTLDLVVLAVEWGHGRRAGWLSNLHLGARDPDSNGFVMLGKTFKGMTDEMLRWQTARLLELETGRSGGVVRVRAELVVEIAFDGLQTSTRYPGGLALRFARVLRYRPDKTAADADTITAVRALHNG